MAGGADRGQEGIDDAFAAIVAGLDFPVPDGAARAGDTEQAADKADDDGASEAPEVALLLPGVDQRDAMAAVCRLAGIAAVCVPSDIGTIVCLDDAGAEAANEAAASFSGMLRSVPVVLLRRGRTNDRVSADVQAARWISGEQRDELAPGLILAQAPDIIENLILGHVASRALPGSLETSSLSRLKATRILARMLRGPGPRGQD